MKKLLSVLIALVMCFGVFSGALAEIVVVPASGRLDENTEYEMIETDLPSGIYDDGRTLIVHPEDGDMILDYDPEASAQSGTRGAASADELDAALNIYDCDYLLENATSNYEPWETVLAGDRYFARSTTAVTTQMNCEFKLTVVCRGGERLSFDYCSITGNNNDYLTVYEGNYNYYLLNACRNHPEWENICTDLLTPGTHVFTFSFYKGSYGSDYYAGIDNITVTSNTAQEPLTIPINYSEMSPHTNSHFLTDIEPPVDGAIPISNAKQLYDIRNNSQGNYYLSCDIDLSELELWGLSWTAISSYSGIFDGQGHTIRTFNEPLFLQATGTIKNLSSELDLSCFCLAQGYWGAALIIRESGDLAFHNCMINGTIIIDDIQNNNDGYEGGLLAVCCSSNHMISFDDCYSNVDFDTNYKSTLYVGGLVGELQSNSVTTFNRCFNFGSITINSVGTVFAGGLVGRYCNDGSWPVFSECSNYGRVESKSENSFSCSGGIVGEIAYRYYHINTISINKCSNMAHISSDAKGKSYVGGLVGDASFYSSNGNGFEIDFQDCYIDNQLNADSATSNAYAGGIIGKSDWYVYANNIRVISSNIRADSIAENTFAYCGGIVGYANKKANIGYCLTNIVNGSAYDSWHVMKGSIVGYVVETLTLTDTCAFNNLNSFAGYYGSIEGRDNAVPYTGDLIVQNANYTIKVVDAQSGGPIPNALVNCDGYKMTTDAFGMVRMTLPVNVMIQITASKNLYAPTTAIATRLSSSGINTISLRYVGDGSNGGSGSGSGSNGGFGGGVNAAGYSFSAPSVSAPTVTATGPNVSMIGKTSPAFKIDLGLELPYSKLNISVDNEKKTIRILLNADIKASYSEDDQGNQEYKAEFENKWKKINDSLEKLRKKEDVKNWKSDLLKSSGKIGVEGDVYFGGAIMLSYAEGRLRLISGSGVMGLKASIKFPKHPFLVICYFQIKLSGSLEYCPTLEIDENSVISYKGTAKVSAKLTGALGVRDFLGLAHAEGGVNCTATTEVTFPWVSSAESLKAKGKVDVYVELQYRHRNYKKSWTWAEFKIWPKSKDNYDIDILPDKDMLKPISRDYLKQTSMLRAVGEESLVINSVFPYGEPQLVELDDGRLVLVWLHDDGSRTDINRTALYYSVYENGEWNEPAIVWDDGTADFSPVIAADGNNVHIVWQNTSEVLADDAELDYEITKTQICYTQLKWDGTIETPYVVDAEGRTQGNICMAADNGKVVVAWKENSSNSIWNETGTYNVYRRYMTSGSWSSTNTVVSGASLITDVACGYIDGTPNVAYIMDVDGNATTVTDLEVYKYVGTSTTRVTNNSVADGNIQYINNDLYWRQDNELRNAGGTLGLSSEDDITLAVAPDGSLVAVIKTVVDGFNTELYGSFRNASGEWSVPAPITNYYGAIRSFSPIVCDDGSIAIALDNAELQEIEEDGDEAYGTTSMHVIVGSSLTDLIVTETMTYDVDAVTPGEDLDVTVTVYNNSIGAVEGVKAEFYDAFDQLVYTANSDETVECGEEKALTFAFPVPEELSLTEYTVKVLPAAVDDDIPDNNGTSITIGYADVAIENGRFNRTENAATITADITNIGFSSAENTVATLRYQGADGDFLGSIDLGNMAAGATEHVSFDIPATYLENDSELDLNTFYLYIETDTAESHAYNNSDAIVDEPIRVTSISLDITQRDMLVHDTLQLNATLQPADAANQLIRWASTNVDVATVDDNGLVTCVGEGSAIIYAISADGVYSEGCMINTQYPYYTVTFLDDDGTVLKTEQVKETSDATPPEVEAREGYTFVGWDGDYTHISGDITLIAQYEINTYHVIYYINGEVYHTDEFEFGSEIVPLDEPELEGYTFMGWDDIPEIMPAEDVIVTGEVEINSYKLNYYVDGQFYHRDTYDYGTYITPIEEPTREDCVFSGWSDIPATMPAHNVNIYGTFSKITYTVTFLDWDGRVIESQQVEIHSDAVPPADPMRIGYTFTGWDGDYTGVEADATVTATYTINSYTVIFKDWDGMVLDMQTVEYGSSAIAPQVPEREGYTFIGWDKEFDFVEENMTVTAQYINNADIVTFEKYDSFELKSGYYVIYGVNGNYHGTMNNVMTSKRMGVTDVEIVDDVIKNPEEAIIWKIDVNSEGVLTIFNEAEGKYLEITINNASGFTYANEPTCGYTYEYDEVTETYLITTTCEDAGDRCISIYQTDFRCLNSGGAKELYLYRMANNHTVTFVDWNGAVLSVQRVNDGEAAYAPTDPEREGYTFIGWDAEFTNVTEDIVITAQYTINNYTLTILYKYADGTPAAETYSEAYDYGAAYSITSPEIEGWTADIVVVEGTMSAQDMTVIVTYSPILPPFIPGDVNSDGIIDSLDVLLIMRFTLGIVEFTDMQMIIGDVNGDGVVNGSDAIIVMRQAIGII